MSDVEWNRLTAEWTNWY